MALTPNSNYQMLSRSWFPDRWFQNLSHFVVWLLSEQGNGFCIERRLACVETGRDLSVHGVVLAKNVSVQGNCSSHN
jgi:hypothetical protein